LNPADLQSAYKLNGATGGSGQTVAIVDAFDDPNAESDLAVYRSQFGLPPCTTANGCFRKVNQAGQASPLPRRNASWGTEISLDLDMVSAICPNCKIILVEANSAQIADLGASVNTAAALGANAISNSYGGNESANDPSTEQSFYNHPGIMVTVSSGDSGFGAQFPASSQFVTAVGGTSLKTASNSRGWTETVWSGAGSGCSAHITKPSWQTDAGCSMRTVADVAAIADPNTGVSVYDTFRTSGWLVFGGTSVASPIIASVYALAGNASSLNYGSDSYSHTSSLFDVTSGSNGNCGGTYLCTGEVGYDGPTGNGTPNGTSAF
jgi:subtilase family serine protease